VNLPIVIGLGLVVAASTVLQNIQVIGSQAAWRPYVLIGGLMTGLVAAWQLVAGALVQKSESAMQGEPLATTDPRRVGPYRVIGRLGAGAMGRVYLARRSGSHELVALKLIRPEYADIPEFRRRFTREIKAIEHIRSPFTTALLDSNLTAEQPWMVTSLVRGPSLQQVIDDGGVWPEDAVWGLAEGVAQGLRAVHAVGVVHRDLKPSNILLDKDGPRVIDFGIARARDASQLTATMHRPGTPAFMAPEQALGQDVGPAADVFALGAILAYATTGRTPFGEGTSDAMLFRVIHQPPDLTGITGGLRQLIADCLAKNPAERPSVDQIIQRCRAHTAGQPWLRPAVQPPSGGKTSGRWHVPSLITASLALLIAAGSLGIQLLPRADVDAHVSTSPTTTPPSFGPTTPSIGPTTPNCQLKIGFMGGLSGSNVSVVKPMHDAVERAIREYGQGSHTCTVTLTDYDTQGDGAKATTKAQTAAGNAKVVAIIGPTFSNEARSALPVFNDAGMAALTPSATAPDLNANGYKTFFRGVGTDTVQGRAAGRYLRDVMRAQPVFVIDDGSAYGIRLASEIKQVLGSAVSGTDTVQQRQTDFTTTIAKAKASGAKAIYYGGDSAEAARLIRQLRDAGMTATFMGPDGILDSTVLSIASTSGAGVLATCPCPKPTGSFASSSRYEAVAYDLAKIVLEGIDAGNTTRSTMLQFLAKYNKRGTATNVTYRWGANGELDQPETTVWEATKSGWKLQGTAP
jgi:serine/threonine protein kinase